MCLACDMEGMWFALMDARARAADGEAVPQSEEPATLVLPSWQTDDLLLPPPERGRVGEGVAGGMDETAVMRGESEDPHPNPPPEEGGGGAPSARQRTDPTSRFVCEETSAE
jgi:hypothetical protein